MKHTKRNKINLVISSFLLIAFVICSYFFSSLATNVTGVWSILIQLLILLLFGLLLFYATRVGEGRAVKRFSLAVLLLVDIPCVYLILATFIEGLPFHTELSSATVVVYLATIALGYAIPYTFLSGFELKEDADEEENEEEKAEDEEEAPVLEGGIVEELLKTAQEEEETKNGTAGEETDQEKEAVEEAATIAQELSSDEIPQE